METPRTLKIMNKAAILGLVITFISFIIPLVPCKGETGFSLCPLPNPFANVPEITNQYYGYSNNPLTGATLQFLIPTAAFMLIFMLTKKRKKEYKDLSK